MNDRQTAETQAYERRLYILQMDYGGIAGHIICHECYPYQIPGRRAWHVCLEIYAHAYSYKSSAHYGTYRHHTGDRI